MKGKEPNPLDELLKEKRLANKRGNGNEAFRQAEAAVKNKDFVFQDMDDLMNEETARVAVSDLERMNVRSSSPSFCTSEDEEISMDEMDRQRLFGEEGGKAIKDIVEGDKVKRQKERGSKKLFGIPLWQADSLDLMEIDEPNSTFPGRKHQHPLLSMIASALENKGMFLDVLSVRMTNIGLFRLGPSHTAHEFGSRRHYQIWRIPRRYSFPLRNRYFSYLACFSPDG